MGDNIEFVRNYHDLSNERGFQFEFICYRCGTGYRTEFKTSVTGALSGVLSAASSLFGGIFGHAADLSGRVHSAQWTKSRDEAFKEAIAEIKPNFMQCPKCSSWVCRRSCWNTRRGLCKHCAPDLGVEASAAQSNRAVQQVWNQAQSSDADKHSAGNWNDTVRATCRNCEKPFPANTKFCPECGTQREVQINCPKCGVIISSDNKFCGECGIKI